MFFVYNSARKENCDFTYPHVVSNLYDFCQNWAFFLKISFVFHTRSKPLKEHSTIFENRLFSDAA